MRPADGVLFDFGGTLDADGVHWSPRYYAAYRDAGGALEFAAFDPLFRASDEAVGRLPGVTALGFRATVDAQARLLLALLPGGDGVDPPAGAGRVYGGAVATGGRHPPVLRRLG